MLQSLDHSTCSNYGAGLLHFTQFCDLLALPEEFRMLASSELISLFSAHHAGHASEKTLNNWLAGLHFWHIVNGAPWHGDDMLRHVCRGFTKLVPPSSKCAKRPPVTIDALCILHDRLDLANTFDASVWALASNAFDPFKHVSCQVLPLSISSLDNAFLNHCTGSLGIPPDAPLFAFRLGFRQLP